MTSNHDEKPLPILLSRCAKPQLAPQGAEVFFEKTQVMFGDKRQLLKQTATTKQAEAAGGLAPEFRIKHHHRYRQVALAVTSIFAAKVGCQQGATTAQAGTAATESRVSAIMSFVRKKCPSVRLVMGK